MKHINKFKIFLENYSEVKNKIDEILDKISSHGIDSLSPEERRLLDSQKEGDQASEEAYSKLVPKDINKEFESNNGRFKFTLKHIETEDSNSDDGIISHFHGIMELPDMITGDGKLIEGIIKGHISINEFGLVQTSFEKEGYTDYDFVEGLEYEYDSFIYEIPNLGW